MSISIAAILAFIIYVACININSTIVTWGDEPSLWNTSVFFKITIPSFLISAVILTLIIEKHNTHTVWMNIMYMLSGIYLLFFVTQYITHIQKKQKLKKHKHLIIKRYIQPYMEYNKKNIHHYSVHTYMINHKIQGEVTLYSTNTKEIYKMDSFNQLKKEIQTYGLKVHVRTITNTHYK